MRRLALILATALAPSLAIGLPAPGAVAQDVSDRLVRGIVNGVLEEFLPQGYDRANRGDDRRYREKRRGSALRGIPPGHYPPPGTCRVWFPDRPPGHQPRPGSCNVRAPRGALLIVG